MFSGQERSTRLAEGLYAASRRAARARCCRRRTRFSTFMFNQADGVILVTLACTSNAQPAIFAQFVLACLVDEGLCRNAVIGWSEEQWEMYRQW